MVALLFQVDGLDWSKPSDHFECFAGDMAVTRAEWADIKPMWFLWFLGNQIYMERAPMFPKQTNDIWDSILI